MGGSAWQARTNARALRMDRNMRPEIFGGGIYDLESGKMAVRQRAVRKLPSDASKARLWQLRTCTALGRLLPVCHDWQRYSIPTSDLICKHIRSYLLTSRSLDLTESSVHLAPKMFGEAPLDMQRGGISDPLNDDAKPYQTNNSPFRMITQSSNRGIGVDYV